MSRDGSVSRPTKNCGLGRGEILRTTEPKLARPGRTFASRSMRPFDSPARTPKKACVKSATYVTSSSDRYSGVILKLEPVSYMPEQDLDAA